MSKLEAGCKAFIINDIFVPENNWKVVTLKKQEHSSTNGIYHFIEKPLFLKVPKEGLYWMVCSEELITIREYSNSPLILGKPRFYKPENLMPLKGDFKLENQTTKNSLPCLSY